MDHQRTHPPAFAPLTPVNAAIIFHSALERSSAVSLGLGVILLVRALYNLYEPTLWDATYDPLGYIWLIPPVLAILLAGVMLSVA